MTWRRAKSLDVLFSEIDAAYPNRSKRDDGDIGDENHAARKSDHNPNAHGVVTAIDITHDPAHGLDSYKLADRLLASHDARLKYIISNGRIGSSYPSGGVMPWNWRPYNGPNAHKEHVHVSVLDDAAVYDLTQPWKFDGELVPEPMPSTPVDSDLHQRMMRKILNYEYAQRPFKISTVTDGSREIAGINQAKLPEAYARVAGLLGDDAAVEREATKFYLSYTNIAPQWHSDPGVEFYLRDCILNRGPTGAAIILQKAVGVEEDGAVGPNTKAAIAKLTPGELLNRLDHAREVYEIEKYGKREKLWKGLQNRWAKALADAKSFMTPAGPAVPEPSVPIPPPTPIPPTPAPPGLPEIDWNRVSKLYSIDWEKVVALQSDAIKSIDAARQEVQSKMDVKRNTYSRNPDPPPEWDGVKGIYEPTKGNTMNSDTMLVAARYILIGGGAFLAGKGYVTMDQVTDFADKMSTIIPGLVSAAATAWGLYVRFGTKAVPVATANRADVPTVSAATGEVKH